MSLREQPWWAELVESLREVPLDVLAERYQVEPSRAIEALAESSLGGAVQDEPWWPEAVRVARTHGIRQSARLFGTNARRLRRGLARAGVRVAGEEVPAVGVEPLVALRDRLGKEPDHVLAKSAGVTVEAVKGERRRLGIAAYRPPVVPRPEPPPPPPAAEEEAPPPRRRVLVRSPEARRKAEQPEPVRSTVLRRRAAVEATAIPAVDARPVVAERPRPAAPREAGARELSRVPTRPPLSASARPTPPAAAEPAPPRPEPGRREAVIRRVPGGRIEREPTPLPRDADASRTRPRPTPEPERELSHAEMLEMLARRKERRGRTMIIRPDRIEIEEPVEATATTPARRVRRIRSPLHGEVREVRPDELDLGELIQDVPESAPRVVVPPTLAGRTQAPGAPVSPEPAAAAPAPEPPVAAPAPEPAADAPEPAAAAPAPEPPVAAPEPPAAAPAPVAEAPVAAPPAPVAEAPAGAASTRPTGVLRIPAPGLTRGAPAPAPRQVALPLDAAPAGGALAWRVKVDDQWLPLVFIADDASGAARQAAHHLDPERLIRASLHLVGPALRG